MAVDSFLPPVVTRLSMNIDDFVSGIAKAKAALKALDTKIEIPVTLNAAKAIADLKTIQGSLSAVTDAQKEWAAAIRDTNTALLYQSSALDLVNGGITSQSRRLATATAWQGKFKSAVEDTNGALERQGAAAVAAGLGRAVGGGGGGGGGRWGWLTGTITLWQGLFGGGLGSINVLHVALDLALESAIALVGSLIDLGGALLIMAPAAQDIYTRLSAINTVNGSLGSSIPPLTGRFEQLAQQVAGPTIGAYGGLLNLMRTNGGAGSIFTQTADALNGYIAKIDIWRQSQTNSNQIMQNGMGYLHQFGSAVFNLGTAFANLLKSDPGTVHVLLGLVQGASAAVHTFSLLPAPILKTVVALHSAWLWGGLAATGMTKFVVPQLMKILKLLPFVSPEAAAAFGSIAPMAVGAAIGMAILANAWGSATNAVSRYVTTQNQAINAMQPEQFVNALPNLINGLNNAAAKATTTLPRTLAGLKEFAQGLYSSNWGKIAGGLGNAVAGFFTNPVGAFNPAVQVNAETAQWQKQWRTIIGEAGNLFAVTGPLLRQGYSMQQAFSMEALAGVKASDSYQLMQQKVKNLITGYGDLGTNAGMLTGALNATIFASEQTSSKITAVTQGFTAFISTVTGGLSNFVTFQQGMATLATDAGAAGASMTGLNASSLALQGQWATQINQAATLINSLYTLDSAGALGAQGQQLLAQASRAAVAEMIPFAKQSTVTRDSLYALAQQGGYRGADSIKALSQWMDHAKNPAKDLQAAMAALTTPASNLARDVTNLANAIDPSMTSAMTGAIIAASGGTGVLERLASTVLTNSGNAKAMTTSFGGVWQQMRRVYGNTQQARDMFDSFAIKLGVTQGAADRLYSDLQASGGRASAAVKRDIAAIQQALAQLNGQTATVHVNVQTAQQMVTVPGTTGSSYGPLRTGYVIPPSRRAYASGTGGAAPGWGWVGEAGPELVRFRGGESVIPSHVSRGYAMGTGGEDAVHEIHVYLDGKQIYRGMQQQAITTQRRTGTNGLTKRSR